MRLGIRLHDVKGKNFEELIANASAQGYDSIQLAVYKAISPEEFTTDKDALTPGMARHIAKVMREKDIECAVLGCYKLLGLEDREVNADMVDSYKKFIRFASYLGAGVVVGTETGNGDRQNRVPYFRTAKALDSYIEDMKEVVAYAEKMGVVVAIEPVCVHVVGTIAETRRILDEVNSPNLQVIYDPVGLIDGANYENRVEIWKEFQEVCGKEICAMHVKDFGVFDGDLKNLPVGKGIMDRSEYEMLLGWAKKNKPYMDILIEDSTPETAPAISEFLRKIDAEA